VRGFLRSRTGVFTAVGVAALGIAAGLIVVGNVGSTDKKATSSTRGVTVKGGTAAEAVFRGIPQKLNVLGDPKAPVTMIEFADLQCPFCRTFALQALPTIVRDYVRPGKVKLVFAGLAFIGPDSERALRATYAAGLQSRLWTFLDLLYRNQGAENSGWVTDDLLRAAGRAIRGLDVETIIGARQTTEVDNAILATSQQATSARVVSTPTFFVGTTGGTLQQVHVSELRARAFRPALDALLK
jgi:protein-disulfide isomerase